MFPSEAHQAPLVPLDLRVLLVKSRDCSPMQNITTERYLTQNNKSTSRVSYKVHQSSSHWSPIFGPMLKILTKNVVSYITGVVLNLFLDMSRLYNYCKSLENLSKITFDCLINTLKTLKQNPKNLNIDLCKKVTLQ